MALNPKQPRKQYVGRPDSHRPYGPGYITGPFEINDWLQPWNPTARLQEAAKFEQQNDKTDRLVVSILGLVTELLPGMRKRDPPAELKKYCR